MIHIYTGDGQGKTCAAFGLAARMLARNKMICVVQFMKNELSGEAFFFKKQRNIMLLWGKGTTHFTSKMTLEEKQNATKMHNINLESAIKTFNSGKCDFVLLDEVSSCVNYNLIDCKKVHDFIMNFPKEKDLVLTGRNMMDYALQKADYITFMSCIRHPLQKGIKAKECEEY